MTTPLKTLPNNLRDEKYQEALDRNKFDHTVNVRGNETKYIELWDTNDPYCLLNLLSEKISEQVQLLPIQHLSMSVEEYLKIHEPTELEMSIRQSFWEEYFAHCDADANRRTPKMSVERIYRGLCDRSSFYRMINNPRKLAYIIKPPQDYMFRMKALLDLGMIRFNEILKLPIIGVDGKPDDRLIGRMIKIFELVDNRVKGAITQKVEIQGKQLNVNINQKENEAIDVTQELLKIESEIKKLKPVSDKQIVEVSNEVNE